MNEVSMSLIKQFLGILLESATSLLKALLSYTLHVHDTVRRYVINGKIITSFFVRTSCRTSSHIVLMTETGLESWRIHTACLVVPREARIMNTSSIFSKADIASVLHVSIKH